MNTLWHCQLPWCHYDKESRHRALLQLWLPLGSQQTSCWWRTVLFSIGPTWPLSPALSGILSEGAVADISVWTIDNDNRQPKGYQNTKLASVTYKNWWKVVRGRRYWRKDTVVIVLPCTSWGHPNTNGYTLYRLRSEKGLMNNNLALDSSPHTWPDDLLPNSEDRVAEDRVLYPEDRVAVDGVFNPWVRVPDPERKVSEERVSSPEKTEYLTLKIEFLQTENHTHGREFLRTEYLTFLKKFLRNLTLVI